MSGELTVEPRIDRDGLHVYAFDPVEGCWVAFRRVDCVGREELPEQRLAVGWKEVWDEGFEAAEHMARSWGHVDHWEDEPTNPYPQSSTRPRYPVDAAPTNAMIDAARERLADWLDEYDLPSDVAIGAALAAAEGAR